MYVCMYNSSQDGVLSEGNWSSRGCHENPNLSNSSVTVCECDHLTHFAILLSAAPLKVSHEVPLQIIGYVGVSLSLFAMLLTITTFIILRYVYIKLRNYVAPS